MARKMTKPTLVSAVTTTITKTCPSVLIAMLATTTGIIAMMFGPIPMVGDFGITKVPYHGDRPEHHRDKTGCCRNCLLYTSPIPREH